MAKQIVNVGTSANDGTGDTLRVSQQKANNNFDDLYDYGGLNITVNNPVTLTETTLDTALSDLVGGGGSVNSVTGPTVDNTDPANPIVNLPTLQEVLDNNADLVDGNFIAGTQTFGDKPTGIHVISIGEDSGTNAFSDDCIYLGFASGNSNSGYHVNAFGSAAASNNTGIYVNSMGPDSSFGNIGDSVNAFGTSAAANNTGGNINALGFSAAVNNSGDNVNALGLDAGVNNSFTNVNLFGTQSTADDDNQTVFSKWISAATKYLARISYKNITADRKYELPDASGTIALLSDIPSAITIDTTPTNGSPNAVSSDGTFDALATKVDKNTSITGATKTKITYDSKGLVTAGTDLAASDLPTGIDAAKINTGVVSNTEFNYLDGVNAPIQAQIDGKLSESDVNIFCDFNSAPSNLQFGFYENFVNSKNGSGYATTAINAPIVDASNMGVWYLKAGGSATNFNIIGSGDGNATLNQLALSSNISSYETFVYLDNLTDSSNFISGFINQILSSTQTNACYFLYNPTANSGRIQCITVNSGTATTTSLTGITVTSKWFKFKVVATSTSVLYYVDGSLVATHTTNIPTARMGYGFGINNITTGPTTVGIYADYFRAKFKNLR